MSKNKSGKIGLVLYEDGDTPKYFELGQKTLHAIIIGLPLATLICLGVTIGVILNLNEIRNLVVKREPVIINNLKREKSELLVQVDELRKTQQELQMKLSLPASEDILPLRVFKQVHGMKDQSQTPIFSIEDIETLIQDKQVRFRFNIVNLSKETQKLAGHAFVIMKDNRGYFVFPKEAMPDDQFEVDFIKGESFATTRFRPVDAVFPLDPSSDTLLFKILIFSRTGDLIHKQIVVKKMRY